MSEYGFLPRKRGFGTRAIHSGNEPEQWPGWDLSPPICVAVTYKQETAGRPHHGWSYSRSGNPSRSALERCLASLEEAQHSLTFSSGMAAVVTLTHLLNSGDNILLVDEVYGGTTRYFVDIASRMNISTTFIDAGDLENVKAAIKPNTKMIFLESPSNPLLKVIDLKEISRIIHEESPEVLVVVDNTFMTAYFQKPLELGVDISIASCTKYYNGHSDVTMGLISVNSEDLYKRLRYLQYALGAIPSPIDCYHVTRSLKTLSLRMEKHMKNGIVVARFLEKHPNVEKVLHPVLESHEQYELARKQSYGHSGMLSFYVKGGEAEARKFMDNLKVFMVATSLGDVGSLVASPVLMTDLWDHQRNNKTKYSLNLLRMSVGLEDAEDLIEDLQQALEKAYA